MEVSAVLRLVSLFFVASSGLVYVLGYKELAIYVMVNAVYVLVIEHDYTQRTQ